MGMEWLGHGDGVVAVAVEQVDEPRRRPRVGGLGEEAGLGVGAGVADLEDVGAVAPALDELDGLAQRLGVAIVGDLEVLQGGVAVLADAGGRRDQRGHAGAGEMLLEVAEGVGGAAVVITQLAADGGADDTILEPNFTELERLGHPEPRRRAGHRVRFRHHVLRGPV
jgi:hypothetical protein